MIGAVDGGGEVVTTLARVALALVFAAAAIGKLADRRGAVAAAQGLGVPAGLAAPVAGLLPVAELAVAVAVAGAWGPSAVVGAAAGLFLLVLMTCLVVLTLRQGRRPPCHCFGRVDDAPIGAGTVVRNLAFMALAVVVLLTA